MCHTRGRSHPDCSTGLKTTRRRGVPERACSTGTMHPPELNIGHPCCYFRTMTTHPPFASTKEKHKMHTNTTARLGMPTHSHARMALWLGRGWPNLVDFGSRPNLVHSAPSLTQVGPKLLDFGPEMVNPGPLLVDMCRTRAKFSRNRVVEVKSSLAGFGPNLVDVCRFPGRSGRFRANDGRFRDNAGRSWPNSAQDWPILSKVSFKWVDVGPPHIGRFRPNLSRVRANLADLGRCCPKAWRCRSDLAGVGQTSAACLARVCTAPFRIAASLRAAMSALEQAALNAARAPKESGPRATQMRTQPGAAATAAA